MFGLSKIWAYLVSGGALLLAVIGALGAIRHGGVKAGRAEVNAKLAKDKEDALNERKKADAAADAAGGDANREWLRQHRRKG